LTEAPAPFGLRAPLPASLVSPQADGVRCLRYYHWAILVATIPYMARKSTPTQQMPATTTRGKVNRHKGHATSPMPELATAVQARSSAASPPAILPAPKNEHQAASTAA